MKYVIASDIHGSAAWCEKLLAAFQAEKADKLVLLGDLLYHGPRNDFPDEYAPKKVFAALNAIKDKIVCVRGNCDSEVDQMVLEFPIMADYALLDSEKGALFATHGHLFNEELLPPLKSGDVLFNGHFHVPCHRELANGVLYANCGSVALPKDGAPHSYILVDGNKLLWKNLASGETFDEVTL
jgi:putative phosphoesterase